MKKKWIITGVIVIILVLIGLNIWKSETSTKVAVKTASLKEASMQETIMTPGVLKMNDEQYVYYQADKGEIDEIEVKAGDAVEKGDNLLVYENKMLDLDKKQNQLDINNADSKLEQAKKDHKSIDEDMDKDPDNEMLEEEHDQIKEQQHQAENELNQALLQKESIENEIDALRIKADVDGTVLDVNEKAGAQGEGSEEAIIRIGSLKDTFVEGTVSEYDTLNVETEQKVELTSDAVPDETWSGEISYIGDLPEEEAQSPGEEETSVDYPLEVTLDEAVELKPGFKMLIEIIISDKEAQTLPIDSVIQEDDDNYVYLVKDGKAKKTDVTIGAVDTEKMEIEKGVTEEDKIIINPPDNITDGMEVTVE